MREILFRGKRKDNGEWIEGSLLVLDADSGYYFITEPFESASTLPVRDLIYNHTHLVDPETVGQFTGLTNKNGVKIFEGDIVIDKEGCLYKVFLQEKYYEFSFECIKSDNKFLVNAKWALWSLPRSKDLEVIGNIFDNPELVEGGEADV